MAVARAGVWIVAAALLLGACSQSDAPSDEVEEVAETLVEEAQGEQPVRAMAAGPFAPRDECTDLDGAGEFHRMLVAAVRARDSAALASLAAEDIKLDGGSGREAFHALLEDEGGAAWQELGAIMAMGCDGDRQKGITIPWYYAQNIPGNPARAMIVTGEAVPLLADPADDAEVLNLLSWDVVQRARGDQPSSADYREVVLPDGTAGYIQATRLRPFQAPRLQAISRNGKWSITSFAGGA